MANDHNVDVCLLLAHSAWVREGLALWGLWFGVEGICWAGTPEPRTQSEGLVAPAPAVLSLQEGVHLLTVPAQCTAPLQYGNAVPEGGGGRRAAGRWDAKDAWTQGPRTHGRGPA